MGMYIEKSYLLCCMENSDGIFRLVKFAESGPTMNWHELLNEQIVLKLF